MMVDRHPPRPSPLPRHPCHLPSSPALPSSTHLTPILVPQSSWRNGAPVLAKSSHNDKDRRRRGGKSGGAVVAVALSLPLKDKLSLFRSLRYQSWRSTATSTPAVTATAAATGAALALGTASGGARGPTNWEWGGSSRHCRDSNDGTGFFDVREGAEAEEAHPRPRHVEETPKSMQTEATLTSSAASSPLPPIVEGGTVTATPESRKVMRHISGLGMEDPTLLFGVQQPQQLNRTRGGGTPSSAMGGDDGALQMFQDMAIEDMPHDIRTTLSVESDPTATLSNDGGNGCLLDMEMFHSSLGHITGWIPSPTSRAEDEEEHNDDSHEPAKETTKPQDSKRTTRPTKRAAKSTSKQAELDTEQLLLNLPCDGDAINGPLEEGGKEAEVGAAPYAENLPSHNHNNSNSGNALCASMIEQALLGASLNSLQSLSLDEIRMHSSMSHFPNPGVFLASAAGTKDSSVVPVSRAKGPSKTEATDPPASHLSQLRHKHHPSSGWSNDRLHRSMPMNVRVIATSSVKAATPRLSKPEFKAPPSVVALSLSSFSSSSSSNTPAKPSHKLHESQAAADKAAAGASGLSLSPTPSLMSSPSRRPGVVIPKKRALPSIQSLFLEDSSPPASHLQPRGSSGSSTGLASC